MTIAADSHRKTFRAVAETSPGPKWSSLFEACWPLYKKWFLSQGDAARPSYLKSVSALRQYMPELLPIYENLVDIAGGGDLAARFLALYCPPPYLSGCTQAVWTGDEPVLVRNYDYSAERLEGLVFKSHWGDKAVIAMIDATWGVLDGINEFGLSVSLAFGGRKDVGTGFGIPIILRYILEFCESTESAIDVLRRVPSHMSYNITVIDRDQRFATVYVRPEKSAVVRQVPVATNHQGTIEWPRHAWATATLERENAANAILRDDEKHVDGLIAGFMHPPIYNTGHHRGFGTLYTAVYRPRGGSAEFMWPGETWKFDFTDFKERRFTAHYA